MYRAPCEIDGAASLLGKVGLDFQLVFGSNVRSDYRAREREMGKKMVAEKVAKFVKKNF